MNFPILEYKASLIIETQTDVIINSANGALIHGTGTAATLSKASGALTGKEFEEFLSLVSRMPGTVGKVFRTLRWSSDSHAFPKPTKLQFECAKFFLTNGGEPIPQGKVELIPNDGLKNNEGVRRIIHAVAITYDFNAEIQPDTGRYPVIPATIATIKEVTKKSLDLIQKRELGTSVAVPIMCTRSNGLTPGQSFMAIREGIRNHVKEGSSLEKIVIVGDDPETAKFINIDLK